MLDLDPFGFKHWRPGPCPVLAHQRVECLLANGTRAIGVAVAFNWEHRYRDDLVNSWKLDTTKTSTTQGAACSS